jgi:formylglycine-generating enzyme required for sulfatase activity
MAARGKAAGGTFLRTKENQMTYGGVRRNVDMRGAVLIALLCVATVLGVGCSTTSGPSESGEDAPLGMVRIPAGSFVMGDGVAYCGKDERQVTLTRAFYLEQCAVTNQEYLDAVQWAYDNGYVTATTSLVQDNLDRTTMELLDLDSEYCEIEFDGVGTFSLRDAGNGVNPDHPVKEVTWYGAARYCDWLSLQEEPPLDRAYEHSGDWSCNGGDPYGAEGYRLPTDAEWEYAAQYDDDRIYPWGNAPPICDLVNYEGCVGWTSPVGSCSAGNSALGLFDMAGNVWEWCNDWHVCDLGTSPATDPVGPGSGSRRVLHGGSWMARDWELLCAYRAAGYPHHSYDYFGVRAARTVNP